MKRTWRFLLLIVFAISFSHGWSQSTIFEKSGGTKTATYTAVIEFYKQLDKRSPVIKMTAQGPTDSGFPLNLVLISGDGEWSPAAWHRAGKVVILINNGIHPGEPDGIEATMMLARDIADKKIVLPENVALAIIPVYNIGGALNRNSFSRVNQEGPVEYGFRGNAQNLDLNRDFVKCDSKNARSFASIFHFFDPDIFIDNHVSDGADYQHTMTLITSQFDKMGEPLGSWVKRTFEPSIYKEMKSRGQVLVPYVNANGKDVSKGFTQFYDPPRYSTGYGSLFQTISFMPETHMLKPFAERTRATYLLMQSFLKQSGVHARQIVALRKAARQAMQVQQTFPLQWAVDTSSSDMIQFNGYEAGYKKSKISGLPVLYYDRNKPYTRQLPFYNHYVPTKTAKAPKAYVIPQGWWAVIELLQLNGVKMERFKTDTSLTVSSTRIQSVKSLPYAYEKHHKNYDVKLDVSQQHVPFRKGDYIIYLDQPARRYIIEMLEPEGDDSFFAWNFFDAILQQKEGFNDYRWNDLAEAFLDENPAVQKVLAEKINTDTLFGKNLSAQLDFIYKRSPWYEAAHRQYPVYRIEQATRL